MDENVRFIAVLDELKARGVISGYVAVAEILGTNKAAISDIKGCRKRLSLDMLRSLKSSYPEINLNWVIMGEGEMFISENSSTHSSDRMNERLLDMIQSKDQIILHQAEQIGSLRERATQLEKDKEQLEIELSGRISPQETARVFTHAPEPQKV